MKYYSIPMFDVIADRSRFPVPGLILIVTALDKSGFLQPSDAALQWLEDTNFTAHISINEMLRQIRFRFESEIEAKIFGMAFGLPLAEDLCRMGWEEYIG